MNLKVIAFDADDTLWVNEPYFQATEKKFCALLEAYLPQHTTAKELFQTEMQNLSLYGYGIKGFMLSMIETALRITDNALPAQAVETIISFGKELLAQPIELLEGVEETLTALQEKYRLVVATKGDLLDQERKLNASGLGHYFHHVEIMSDKREKDFQKLIHHLDIAPAEFLMVGNSLKSDILPVLAIGGYGFHVPYHTTWAHEHIEHTVAHEHFKELRHLNELLHHLPV